jgi:pyridinium-3,5-bisthiocarboxylic acid mononucleotide nickel chelatase
MWDHASAAMADQDRLAYFDCASGASGEMFLGALLSAGLLEADLRDTVAPLQRAGAAFELVISEVEKGPVSAVQVAIGGQVADVEARLEHMVGLVRSAQLAPSVMNGAISVMTRLLSTEARHAGKRTDELVLRGTSAIDTVVAAVGVVGALGQLRVRRVFSSPVNVGTPQPVVAALLAGAPTYADSPGVPLVTQLGAALLAELVSEWPASPPFAGGSVGHGAGVRDLPRPNVMRCFLGYGTIPTPVNATRPE